VSLELLKKAHNWFHEENEYIYAYDLARLGQLEHWQIIKPNNGIFRGDCEDAALAKMNYMLRKGSPEKDVFIVRCATELCPRDKPFDHAILLCIDNGQWWFSDIRYVQYGAVSIRSLRSYNLYDAVSIDNLRGIGTPKLIGMI